MNINFGQDVYSAILVGSTRSLALKSSLLIVPEKIYIYLTHILYIYYYYYLKIAPFFSLFCPQPSPSFLFLYWLRTSG